MIEIASNKKILTDKSRKGFALLLSVLLASFLITLGISIFSISLKEIQISTSIRDSQIAYYVADSARECALYWDVKKGAFPACLSSDCSVQNTATINPITCNGISVSIPFTKDVSNPTYFTPIITNFFQVMLNSSSTPAADLRLTKTYNQSSQSVVTTIETWGHNNGIIGRRVERGIRQINN